MKDTKYILLALFFLTACTIEQTPIPGSEVFTAVIEQEGETKLTIGGSGLNYRLQWDLFDKVSIGGVTYVLQSTSTGTLEPETAGSNAIRDADGKYKAYFPADICSNGSPALPGTVTLNTVMRTLKPEFSGYYESFIDWGASFYGLTDSYEGFISFLEYEYGEYYSLSEITDISTPSSLIYPMYAESVSNHLRFRNICSLLEIELDTAPGVYWAKIESTQKPLWGPFSVQDYYAVIDDSACAPSEIEAHKTLWVKINHTPPTSRYTNCPSGGIKYLVAVPAGEYPQGSLSITFTNEGKEPLMPQQSNAEASARLLRSHFHEVYTQIPYLSVRHYSSDVQQREGQYYVIGTHASRYVTLQLKDHKFHGLYFYPHVRGVGNFNKMEVRVMSGLENLWSSEHKSDVITVRTDNDYEEGSEAPVHYWNICRVYPETNPTSESRSIVVRFSLKDYPDTFVEYTIVQPGNPEL